MWPFSSKISLEESGVFQNFTDCHCHILPGVDDGVETQKESRIILSRLEELGFRKVWLTPHIMADIPNTTDSLHQHFSKLQSAYKGPITLHLSAEYMIDSLFLERLQANDLLPWGDYGNRLLVETSYYEAPNKFYDILDNIKSKGFYPILAHPERYLYMKPLNYLALKEKGIEFQLNLFSFFGLYDNPVKDNARFLLEEGLYEYVATDLHRLDTLESVLQEKVDMKTIKMIKRITTWQNKL